MHRSIPMIFACLVLAGCGLVGGPQKQLDKAQQALREGTYAEAALLLRNLLESHPENDEARLLLARVLARQGNATAAMQMLDAARGNGTAPSSVARARVLLAIEQGDFTGALATIADDEAPLDAAARDYLRARLLQGQRRITDALSIYQNLAAAQPDSADLQLRIGQCHAFHGRATLALAAAERAIQLSGQRDDEEPVAAEAWLLKFTLAQRARDTAAADAAMAAALEAAPGQLPVTLHAQLLAGAVGSALAKGDHERAAAGQAVLEKLLPQSPLAESVGAQVKLAGDKPSEAVAALQQLRQSVPDFTPARPLLVGALLRTGAMEQALREAGELASQSGDNASAKRLGVLVRAAAEQPAGSAERARAVISALVELNQPAAARTVLDSALAAAPDDKAMRAAAIQLDLHSGRAAEAITRARSFLESDASDPVAMSLLAEAQLASGDAAGAAGTYLNVWQQAPSAVIAVALYQARKQAQLPNARESLQQWLARNPDDEGVRMALALDLQSGDEMAPAAREYERILARAGAASLRTVALNNLAWLYYRLGDQRALDTARRAHESAPGQATVADTYGWLLLQKGRTAEALPLLEQAAAQTPESAEIRYHHAAVLARSGQAGAARELLRDVLLDPGQFEGRADAEALLAQL